MQQCRDIIDPKQGEIGKLIYNLRVKRGISMAQFAARVGINASYLGQIEQGKRFPQDEVIRNIADHFNLDENALFEMVGRVPLAAREELEKQTLLQHVVKEMAKIKISEEKKQDIYKEFFRIIQRVAYPV